LLHIGIVERSETAGNEEEKYHPEGYDLLAGVMCHRSISLVKCGDEESEA